MSFKLNDREFSDFASLVSSYASDELASPTRSTVPLLAFWARPEPRLTELSANLGLVASGAHEFWFEYPVPPQRGSGKASFTDLMVLGQWAAVAIEAKFMEPPYETVKSWLGEPASENRKSVLAGWLQLIKDTIGVELSRASLADYPYQLVHRTASACYPKSLHRWVVYQLFSEERVAYYRSHLANLAHVLGDPAALRFGLLLSPPEITPEYVKLQSLWASGERDLSDAVRTGLVSEALFKFNRVVFTEVGSRDRSPGVSV